MINTKMFIVLLVVKFITWTSITPGIVTLFSTILSYIL
jgi:hypothetical protein